MFFAGKGDEASSPRPVAMTTRGLIYLHNHPRETTVHPDMFSELDLREHGNYPTLAGRSGATFVVIQRDPATKKLLLAVRPQGSPYLEDQPTVGVEIFREADGADIEGLLRRLFGFSAEGASPAPASPSPSPGAPDETGKTNPARLEVEVVREGADRIEGVDETVRSGDRLRRAP